MNIIICVYLNIALLSWIFSEKSFLALPRAGHKNSHSPRRPHLTTSLIEPYKSRATVKAFGVQTRVKCIHRKITTVTLDYTIRFHEECGSVQKWKQPAITQASQAQRSGNGMVEIEFTAYLYCFFFMNK